jgi:hypothetical protein
LFCIVFPNQIHRFRLALFTTCVAGYLWAQFWNLTDEMYIKFNEGLRAKGIHVEEGVFQEEMRAAGRGTHH